MLTNAEKHRSNGFSLVELMIGIVILAIVTTFAMPLFTAWIQNTRIRNTAESILRGMQRARSEAVTRNTSVAFTIGGANAWTVTQVSDNSEIEAQPAGEQAATTAVTILPLNSTTITFGSLGTVRANADATASISRVNVDSTILPAADSRELSLMVEASSIRMCDPNPSIPSSDPRFCE